MNESTQSDTPRTEKEKQSFPLHDQRGITWHDIVYADFSRQLEKPLNRLCKMAGFEITKGDNEGTAAEKVSATIAKFKQIERELNEAWNECERLRLLVPTTAQHMVYHSLLTKYDALKNELNQWKECADELAESGTVWNKSIAKILSNGGINIQRWWQEIVDSQQTGSRSLAHYNQLKQGEGK